jgi:coenzyme F420-0:L-glutamate ligase/coenzyme F420-1:gamma-L-glutamate ligase
MKLELLGLKLPEIKPGDDLAKAIVEAARSHGVELRSGDVVAVTSKVVSKSVGSLYTARNVKPSAAASKIARRAGLDPRFVEILVRESDEILLAIPFRRLVEKGIIDPKALSKDLEQLSKAIDLYPTLFITVRDCMLWTDSGIDSSNHPPGVYSIPPRNLDLHARRLSERIEKLTGARVAVVICDTEVMPGGALDIARGSYGLPVLARRFGEPDMYGKPKFGGADNIANAICAAAGLLMGQHAEGIPVVVVRGLEYEWREEGVLQSVKALNLGRVLLESIIHTLRVLGPLHILRLVLGLSRRRCTSS